MEGKAKPNARFGLANNNKEAVAPMHVEIHNASRTRFRTSVSSPEAWAAAWRGFALRGGDSGRVIPVP